MNGYFGIAAPPSILKERLQSESLMLPKGSKQLETQGISGEAGYVKICEIVNQGNWNNGMLFFTVIVRSDRKAEVKLVFSGAAELDNTSVYRFSYSGNFSEIYIYNSSNNHWEIYVKKISDFDYITIANAIITDYFLLRNSITWIENSQVSSLPSGAIQATLAE